MVDVIKFSDLNRNTRNHNTLNHRDTENIIPFADFRSNKKHRELFQLLEAVREALENLPKHDGPVSYVIRFTDKIINDAIQQKAKLIRIDRGAQATLLEIHFKFPDGWSHYCLIAPSLAKKITMRLKIMADLDISNNKDDQEGEVNRKVFSDFKINIGIQTFPIKESGVENVLIHLGSWI